MKNRIKQTLVLIAVAGLASAAFAQMEIHDPKLEPKHVNPGPVGGPPSDAVVLFDGKDLSQWVDLSGKPARWEVQDGAAIAKGGDIKTVQSFGDRKSTRLNSSH